MFRSVVLGSLLLIGIASFSAVAQPTEQPMSSSTTEKSEDIITEKLSDTPPPERQQDAAITTENPPKSITIKPPGSTEELRPNLVGLANMAIVHLPQSLTFHHVIKATREIIDGVRYELIVLTQDNEKNEVICWLVIIEKPWITTEYGDKYRSLRNTNCTVEENDKFDPSKYEGNTIFNSSNTKVTQGELSDLEEQILANKNKKPTEAEQIGDKQVEQPIAAGVIKGIESQIVVKDKEKDSKITPNFSDGSLSLLDTLFAMNSTDSNQKPTSDTDTLSKGDENLANVLPNNDENPAKEPENSAILPNVTADAENPKNISDDAQAFLDSIMGIGSMGVDTSTTTERQEVIEPEHVVIRVTPPSSDASSRDKVHIEQNEENVSNHIVKTVPSIEPVGLSADSKAFLEAMFGANGGIPGEHLPQEKSTVTNQAASPQLIPLVFTSPGRMNQNQPNEVQSPSNAEINPNLSQHILNRNNFALEQSRPVQQATPERSTSLRLENFFIIFPVTCDCQNWHRTQAESQNKPQILPVY